MHLTCDHGWDCTSWRSIRACEGTASSIVGTALWAAWKSFRYFVYSKEKMQGDFFHSLFIHFPLIFSLSFSSIISVFPFPFLFPVSLCLFHAHCSAAIPLYFPLSPSLYSFPLPLFTSLLLYSFTSAAIPPVPSFQLSSPHSCQVVLLFLQSCPVIVLFVFKFTFHGYAQQNTSKNTCMLHKVRGLKSAESLFFLRRPWLTSALQ